MDEIRVRYAPSPTGYLHIGNARTAIFNYLYAKHGKGKFIVRIEDTDTKRNIEDGVQSQLENLKWLGVTWDESIDVPGEYGPYSQMKRFNEGIYNPFVKKLLDENKAYKCFCTTDDLDTEAKKQKDAGIIPKYSGKCSELTPEQIASKESEGLDYTIRFRVPNDQDIKWNDIVKGNVLFNSKDVSGDFNIIKRDGIPTYNFAVVIDDHLMKISHVLRGEDHISNTPKQIMIYEALGLEIPTFGHMSLIVNESGKKLSKRDGGIIQFIEQYKELGYIPEAIFNFITLLGWSPEGKKEIFSKEQLIDIFDEKRLSKSSATFDVNKLKWINNNYMKALDDDEYIKLVYPFLNEKYNVELNQRVRDILLLYKNQISYGKEIQDVVQLFFEAFEVSDELIDFLKTIEKDKLIKLKDILLTSISSENFNFTPEELKEVIAKIQDKTNLTGKNLYKPIRIMTTQINQGPELLDTLALLGKEKIIQNIKEISEKLQEEKC